MSWSLCLGLFAAVMGTLYAIGCASWVLKQSEGGATLQIPYLAIKEGANAFLKTQYGVIALVGAIIFLVLLFVPQFGALTALGFALGGICSGASGAFGMMVSVRSNVRTTVAAQFGLTEALRVSYRAGSVTGFLVGGLALASLCSFYWLLLALNGDGELDLRPLAGMGFGASLISIFARLGGGIFTKAADVGADLAGKIEQGIPEDDPRNPAVIADNVGDNVGDCAGMAADVFESFVVTLVAAMLIAAWTDPSDLGSQHYPLAVGGVALLGGILGSFFVRLPRSGNVLMALTTGIVMSIIFSAVGFYLVSQPVFLGSPHYSGMELFGSTIVGLLVGVAMVASTNYFTNSRYSPVLRIAQASVSGHATNIITGLAVGMKSTVVPTLVIAVGVVTAYGLAGVYGIAVATCALLSLTPMVISIDAYGPVTDNAGGIAEMAQLPDEVREVTDALDAAGNTTKALTKVFAIGSAGLAALAMFVAYKLEVGGAKITSSDFTLGNPYVLAGLFIGSLLPFAFSGLALDAVGKSASRIVEEVRRQFQEFPDILSGERKPDYAQAVRMLTKGSIQGMILPGSLPVVVPVAIAGLWSPLGPPGSAALLMGGVLIGGVASGLILAFSMGIGGAAWDNAKKYIEAGHLGGKGSPAHQAAVTGDTVGDPYKDTAGPAINPMNKVLSLMGVLLGPFLG